MKSKHTLGIAAMIVAGAFFLWRTSREDVGEVLPPSRSPHGVEQENSPESSSGPKMRLPIVGEIHFEKQEEALPSGDWLKRTDQVYESAQAIPPEETQSWHKPSVYYDSEGRIAHAYFNSGVAPTVPLDGMAEADFQKAGLAVVRHGYPSGVSAEKLTSDFLRASLEYWEMGGEVDGREISITPVVVRVLEAGPDLGTSDRSLVGSEVPMIFIKVGRQFADSHAILSDSRFDAVQPEDRIRRTWTLLPYLRSGEQAAKPLPDLSGGAVYDEPKLEAWEKVQAEAKKGR